MSLDIRKKAGWDLTWIREVLWKHTKKQHCLLVFDVLQALKRAKAYLL